jgi:hypothetical protein
MKTKERTYWILATLLFFSLFNPAAAEECCQKESQLPCCCPAVAQIDTDRCVPSVCDGGDLGGLESSVALLSPVLDWYAPRSVEIQLEPETTPKSQPQIQPVVSNDRAPPLKFLDETLLNLPPPA